jgi:hypothetical protein
MTCLALDNGPYHYVRAGLDLRSLDPDDLGISVLESRVGFNGGVQRSFEFGRGVGRRHHGAFLHGVLSRPSRWPQAA